MEPEIDFNWMTAARWTKLQSSLWRLFDSLTNWKQDARMLKTKMLVDHFEVSLRATEKYLTAAQTLLKNEALTQNDLELEIVLKYISQEDTTIRNEESKKRKQHVEAKSTHSDIKNTLIPR